MKPLLQVEQLQVSFHESGPSQQHAVYKSDFTIEKGRITAIVGESGSGKSVTALSVLKLLPPAASVSGKILFSEIGEDQVDLIKLSDKDMRRLRGNRISMIFQEPMTSLNPVYTCGDQVMEAILEHQSISRSEARKKVISLFKQVELPDPEEMIKRFPHELSGGQKQRVMIAMAMSCDPILLIADEPTTALDVRVQKNILGLIKNLQSEKDLAVMLITHDLGLVADIADDIIVMFKGKIIESGRSNDILKDPQQDYTKALIECRPANNPKGSRLPVIGDDSNADERFFYPEKQAGPVLLSVENLSIEYRKKSNRFFTRGEIFRAVDNVSFEIRENEMVGLVGESGCGKTTLGRAILQLIPASSGKILMNGQDLATMPAESLRLTRRDIQVVFQDPYGSLNPRVTIGEAILEPLRVHYNSGNKNKQKESVIELLEKVKLDPSHYNRYPHQFSGGQRQRICIARALILNPSFLVFDESVSALDVSVQAQVLNLINELRSTMNFTSLFISHDLSVVHHISDRIMVMQKGKIIENRSASEVYNDPREDYTQELIDSIPGRVKR